MCLLLLEIRRFLFRTATEDKPALKLSPGGHHLQTEAVVSIFILSQLTYLLSYLLTYLLTYLTWTQQHSVDMLHRSSKHNNTDYNSLPQSILVVLVKWRHRANALLCPMFKSPTFVKVHINFIFSTFTNWHSCNFYCALPSTMCFFAFSSNAFDALKAATMLMWALFNYKYFLWRLKLT